MNAAAYKPVLFIGSSTEGHEIAKELTVLLGHSCKVEDWSQDVFVPSKGALESLVQALERCDFAVLVLSADDSVTKRGKTVGAPRDNLLFELGLFTGGIGRERTYMLYDWSKKPELPTDLAGITAFTYEFQAPGSLGDALGNVAVKIKQQMRRLGPRRKGNRRVVHFNLGVNLGWLQQGAEYGGLQIGLMLADLERVMTTATDAGYKTAVDLVAEAQRELKASQRGNSVLSTVIQLVREFNNRTVAAEAAALNLGVVLGRLQQGAIANNFPPSEAQSSLESARSYALKAQYHSYDGFIEIALTRVTAGQPIASIALEITHLMGLFQGQL